MKVPYEERIYQIYVYRCPSCGAMYEKRRLIKDRHDAVECDDGDFCQGSPKLVLQAPAIHVLGFSGTVDSLSNWSPPAPRRDREEA